MSQNKFETHVFVCESCSYKKDGDLCHPDTAKILRKRVKELCAQQVDRKVLRVNGSGCLGYCDLGINAVIYPQGQWLHNLVEGDEFKLTEAIMTAHQAPKA